MQITLRFDDELAQEVKRRKPKRQALSAFCLDLIEQSLTGSVTYPRAVLARETIQLSRSSTPSVPSSTASVEQEPGSSGAAQTVQAAVPLEPKSSTETITNTVLKKRKKTVCTEEFEAFWKLYQSCPLKANCQRKSKAWEEWRKAIEIEPPERLTEALENAIGDINTRRSKNEFAAPLPDCFRWLRDGYYTAALEVHEEGPNLTPKYKAWCELMSKNFPDFVPPHLKEKK